MEKMSNIIKKQKQLIEIELGNAAINKNNNIPNIHSQIYYVKLAYTYKYLDKTIKLLNSLEKDIQTNYGLKH